MKVRTLLKRGADHPIHCEDDLFLFNEDTTYIGAVFDGCSTGVESHFASALYSKILKMWCRGHRFDFNDYTPEKLGRKLYKDFHFLLGKMRAELDLDYLEILSTMILVIIREDQAYVLVSGDGCIYLSDGKSVEETKIESPGNAPDYLAYHLGDTIDGFASLKEFNFKFEKTLSICSDGIYSFTDKDKKDCTDVVIPSLLGDESMLPSQAMLGRKYNLLLKEGYSNYDDVSIIRFIL